MPCGFRALPTFVMKSLLDFHMLKSSIEITALVEFIVHGIPSHRNQISESSILRIDLDKWSPCHKLENAMTLD